jgi:hypothetical protein
LNSEKIQNSKLKTTHLIGTAKFEYFTIKKMFNILQQSTEKSPISDNADSTRTHVHPENYKPADIVKDW